MPEMESELIRWLASEFNPPRHALTGIGDDAAVLPVGNGELVVTCDTICDGVHFRIDQHSPEQIGRKALAVNLSDLAAMGATPLAATVSLVLPRQLTLEYVKRLYAGMRPLADQFQCDICGGDTNVWDGPLVLSVSAFGSSPPGGTWHFSTARAGDRILVTGQFGGSILGKHLSFQPHCAFAAAWRESGLVRACTDVTDSLGLDLAKMATASGVGFVLRSECIPLAPAANKLAQRDSLTALDHALRDGEDFELIVAASPASAARLLAESRDIPLADIGEFTGEPEFRLISGERVQLFEPIGYRHQLGESPAGDRP